ncbi:MAG TPA: glycosyltransferase family 39 protein [Candidatus Polarisedimenticolia bacterium]|nr:glycosyltransferase family 39 protein [Candidatus Polarisedimenticolia bacterium]
MTPARRVFPDHPLIVGLLIFGVFLETFLPIGLKSPAFDEPAHIGAGLSYLKTGEFKDNPQHPPLLKEIAAVPLWLIGVRWPLSPAQWARLDFRNQAYLQWQLGRAIIFDGDPDRIMFWSRLPFVGLTVLLGWLLYAWGRRLCGGVAGVGALLLYACDPTIAAHGYLVTTDVGFAAFTVLFLFALWHWLNDRTAGRLGLCGLALGGVLATKFSAVILLPIAALLVLAAIRLIPEAVPRRLSSIVDPYASGGPATRLIWSLGALAVMGAVAAVVVHALYFFPGDPLVYLKGLHRVNADHDPNYWPFMAGTFRPRFWSYYLLAYLLKEPLPSILLLVAGLFAVLRRGSMATLDRLFLLLPPAALFAAYTLFSHNLGFRYVIPALPFLHLVGGAGLAWLIREGRAWRRLAAAGLAAWAVIGAAGIYPDGLSYFNELACLTTRPSLIGLDGGTRCGTLWFDDSNVDWGQGLKQLRGWIDRHAAGRPLRLGYFGSLRPEDYGIQATLVNVEDLARPPQPGLYALSAHVLARARGELAERYGDGPANWLSNTKPTAIVGHAYYIYDIPPAAGG